MRKVYLAVVLFLCAAPGFSQLYRVENTEKEQNSTLIIEGKVVEQKSFWNEKRSMIFTANKIKVYKLFKGEISGDYIEVLTQGGTVGDMSVHASELLELDRNQVGVFFCFPNQVSLKSPLTGAHLYDVYASAQGFFNYELYANTAGCPFMSYNGIEEEVYPAITTLTGKNYTVVDPAFSVKNFRGGLASRSTATISSFTPSTVNAGATLDPTNNLLTITGTGFGNLTSATAGAAAILFADGNSGGVTNYEVAFSGAEIVSWTDTEIKVRVPTRASTGGFSVRDAAGNVVAAPGALTVNYSIITFNGKQSNLMDINTTGGYTINYSENMTAAATTTFNRALDTWIEVAGANLTKGVTTTTVGISGSGECVVMMDNAGTTVPPLSSGVLGVCYSYNSSCGTLYDNRKPDFDIILRSSFSTGSTSFSYGPCAPTGIDLETVILHELGHGLNLGHINDGSQGSNPGKLMHYAVSSNMKRVSPDNSAYTGCRSQVNGTASNFGPCTVQTRMTSLSQILDAKDEVPTSWPSSPTSSGVSVNFDLAHATSNKKNDPPHNIILCSASSTNVTNNLYYPIKTANLGNLSMTVTNYQVVPSSASTECTGSVTPTVRMALFEMPATPTSGDDYGNPVSCLSFTGNSILPTISGLQPNTNYMLYVDGKANTMATFTVIFNGTALPLKLEKFTGEALAKFNRLSWSIATFNDVEKLVLQKSGNGTEFSDVHEQYDFTADKDYGFDDYKPLAGTNYYRLATVNKDGSVEYSKIVILNREDETAVEVFPNPVRGDISLTINTAEKIDGLEIRLYNNLGQLLLTRKATAVAGLNKIQVPVSTLATGTYRLVVSDRERIISSKTVQKF